MVVAATDGSCIGNPGPGGWAWVTEDGRELAKAARNTTNNRMELMAVLQLLLDMPPDEPLIIQTDSAYVIGVFTEWLEGWRSRGMRTSTRRPVENVNLIEEIAARLKDRDVKFEKVPGHAGHRLNERADALAQAAARRAVNTVAREARST